jgi:hypothetical protein
MKKRCGISKVKKDYATNPHLCHDKAPMIDGGFAQQTVNFFLLKILLRMFPNARWKGLQHNCWGIPFQIIVWQPFSLFLNCKL